MATAKITLDQPIRVGGELDADEIRRLLAIISSRVTTQFQNIAAMASAFDVAVTADPVAPIRDELKASGGIARTESGIAVRLSDLPEARLTDGWIVVASGDGVSRISLRAISGGPYFPGIHMLVVDPNYGEDPVNNSTVASWSGSSLYATENNVHTLLGLSGPVKKGIDGRREYVTWLASAIRSGASRSQG